MQGFPEGSTVMCSVYIQRGTCDTDDNLAIVTGHVVCKPLIRIKTYRNNFLKKNPWEFYELNAVELTMLHSV